MLTRIVFIPIFPSNGLQSYTLITDIYKESLLVAKKKTAKFKSEDIDLLAKDKPVVYKILDKNDNNIYTGVAKRGRVDARIKEHLPKGKDPIPGGVKVKIEQKPSIGEALKSEAKIIKKSKPKLNKKGK